MVGELSEEQFRPLRLQNGLYIQAHAPMLRIAIPYGLMSSKQVHALADICDKYDRGYGHFSTRQNIQLNWVKLDEIPDLLDDLADVGMHAIQTSGNCIRNVTSDQYAGVAPDELEDPRPWCELLRQWSTFHPEFAFLPRKFKIAVIASNSDRAAIQVHDIGIQLVRTSSGETSFNIYVGGGLGRTPVIGKCIKKNLPSLELLRYVEAIMRVYNLHGRRDNKFKARIKILVNAMGPEAFAEAVDEHYEQIKDATPTVNTDVVQRLREAFVPHDYELLEDVAFVDDGSSYANWYKQNTSLHKVQGYRIVNLSLKAKGLAPGDIYSNQLHAVAALADEYSFGEIRSTHTQNLVLADVKQSDLPKPI